MGSVVSHFTERAGVKDYTPQLQEVSNLPTVPMASGGFADIYKVILREGSEIAVKCLKNTEGEHKQVKVRWTALFRQLTHNYCG